MNKSKIKKLVKLHKELAPHADTLRKIQLFERALSEATSGQIESGDYGKTHYIRVQSPEDFGYYRGEDEWNRLISKYFTSRLGIDIVHHDDPFGDDYDVSFIIFAFSGKNFRAATKAAKKFMPKLKVTWTENCAA